MTLTCVCLRPCVIARRALNFAGASSAVDNNTTVPTSSQPQAATMSLEVVNDSILNSPEGEEYAGPDMSAGAANVPRDSGIGPLPASAATSGGEYKLPADLLRAPHSRDRAGGGGGAADDSDDDDDEIAATLPIYLHHSLAPALTQFQYPLQHRNLRVPTWAEERGKKITARVKEQSGRIDVEVPIDADPKVSAGGGRAGRHLSMAR